MLPIRLRQTDCYISPWKDSVPLWPKLRPFWRNKRGKDLQLAAGCHPFPCHTISNNGRAKPFFTFFRFSPKHAYYPSLSCNIALTGMHYRLLHILMILSIASEKPKHFPKTDFLLILTSKCVKIIMLVSRFMLFRLRNSKAIFLTTYSISDQL